MGFFFRRPAKPVPATGLHRDTCTPAGTIWSLPATPDAEDGLAGGDLVDQEQQLKVGDIINVRAARTGSKRFTLRVTGRDDDVVHCKRVRH